MTKKRFNPSVGILWGLAYETDENTKRTKICFNPSVGILWGLAISKFPAKTAENPLFQSLGRDSVGFSNAFAL